MAKEYFTLQYCTSIKTYAQKYEQTHTQTLLKLELMIVITQDILLRGLQHAEK